MRKSLLILAAVILIQCSSDLPAQRPNKSSQDKINGQNGVERNEPIRKKNQRLNGPAGKKSTPDPNALFDRLDLDGDGKLTAVEVPERMQRRLAELDIVNDGAITRWELTAAFARRVRDSRNVDGVQPGPKKKSANQGFEQNAASMIKRIDQNSDGRISQEEAPDRMNDKFARMDANGDGFVDAQEFDAVMQKIKGGKTKNRYDTDPEATKGQLPKRPPGDR